MEPFRDPAVSTGDRVADLMSRMTIDEKIGQLNQRLLGWRTWRRDDDGSGLTEFVLTGEIDRELERTGGIGAVYGLLRADAWSGQHWGNGAGPQQSAEVTAMVQEKIVGSSRLGIPALFAEEAPHGHQALGGTVFPTNIGLAASWRPELLTEAAAHIGTELRARGTHLALMSGLDLLRDPRWGRSEECFGEDPLLASLFTQALVHGLQSVRGVGAVLKHFAAQGAGIGGRNGSGAPIGARELAEIHLPAARAGVEAGAVGLMAAYNDIDGVPCIGNADLLTRILRQEWGFAGLVMADMGAIDRLAGGNDKDGGSLVQAAAVALHAGVDLSLCDTAYTRIGQGITDGAITDELVDLACARVLGVKIKLGLLDAPEPAPAFPPPVRAAELTSDSMVLISNDGTLPLRDATRVAVIGPNADDLQCMLGDYVAPPAPGTGTTVLDGLRRRIGEDKINNVRGCALTEAIDGGIERAVAAAERCDLVVLALGSSGERHYTDAFADNGAAALSGQQVSATTGEGFDVAEVELPAAQRALVDAVIATGTPTVAVIISGRPLGLATVVERCAATLLAWYPGPDGGRAIAELIMGDREPTGRLPVSLPRSSATLPMAYNQRLETVKRYVDAPAEALFDFGFGLGYTDWQLGASTIRTHDSGLERLTVSAVITNNGTRSGRQIVQLYGRAHVPGLQSRRAVLLGFTPVSLTPGETTTITVNVDPAACPGLGDPARGELAVWLSITGAGAPSSAHMVELSRCVAE